MGKILVVGSLNVDMVMNVDHMPAEGETILCDGMTLVPGGKVCSGKTWYRCCNAWRNW